MDDWVSPQHGGSDWITTVRWAECDPAGIIYHARVFDWFSEARAVWLREHGLDYYREIRSRGIELLVRDAGLTFRHALRPGDRVVVKTILKEYTATRALFNYRVIREVGSSHTAVYGQTSHVFVVNGRARRLDRAFPDLAQRFQEQIPT